MALYGREIELAPMQQLTEALDTADDWTGLADATARRKRQNRLNQRAYRRRTREALSARYSKPRNLPVIQRPKPLTPQQEIDHCRDVIQKPSPHQTYLTPLATTITTTTTLNGYNSSKPRDAAGSLGPSFVFPLSIDHLIILIEFNVFQAFITNLSLLSLLHTVMEECDNIPRISPLPTPAPVPLSLAPTRLQQIVPHPPWIDTVPLAAMRDNLINAYGTYEEEEMCSDMLGSLFKGYKGSERRGLIVWTDPWNPSAWEVSQGFAAKWSFLLKGCRVLVESTNRWRALREEEPLVVDI